jgi:hypothetical protein
MRRCTWIAALILTIIAGQRAGADAPPSCGPDHSCLVQRIAPAGGWRPYGGGLLHWWNPHCFPCAGCPDDYCRKPLPCLCWPAYPPFYVCGAPAVAPVETLRPKLETYPAGPPSPGKGMGQPTR